ncbi:response regulator [Paenibacillus whitsoniae]|uniref:Response regulator n=1 Tax=Paenibacillus whitsoniae TaxID=2496558 RepID=A0A3S0BU05_9BACL|nr:response regulator [Paenibacillus whitsoniae]RTE08322.1 response regulator [Paenibacillus whitsoniae]
MTEAIRMCVIDDIKTVVEGIATQIDWEAYGIRITGTASNGQKGLELIDETEPHIVLTDIRMPRLSGLEMTKQVLQKHPRTKIVFMSGYTDFQYAQQAVQLGAFDYIVKPINPKKMIDVVLKARHAIEEEMGETQRYHEMERKLRESLPYLRQEYFQLLLQFRTTPEQAARRWDFLNIGLSRERFAVMLAEIDQFMEQTDMLPVQEVELIRFTVHNILEETLGRHTQAFVFRDNTNRFVAIFNPTDSFGLEAIAEQCRENVAKFSRYTVSLGLGEEVAAIHQISHAYAQALAALSYSFYTGGNTVYSFPNKSPMQEELPRYSPEKEKELFYCLRSGNLVKACAIVDELFEETLTGGTPPAPQTVKGYGDDVAFLIKRVFSEKLTDEEMKAIEREWQSIKNLTSFKLTELRTNIKELCRIGCERIQKRQTEEANQVVEQVIAYIRQHVDSDMTVNDYAKLVYLSGSYFANLFKKVTGMTVVQFVTSERMERAKVMLVEGKQVQDIAQSLGYEDRPHFSELFKKHTGMTPSEFKQLYSGKE